MAVYLIKLEVGSALSGHDRHKPSLYKGTLTVLVRASAASSAREKIGRFVVIATVDDKYRTVLREYSITGMRRTSARKYEGVGLGGTGAPVIVRAALEGYAGMHAGKFLLPGKAIWFLGEGRLMAR